MSVNEAEVSGVPSKESTRAERTAEVVSVEEVEIARSLSRVVLSMTILLESARRLWLSAV